MHTEFPAVEHLSEGKVLKRMDKQDTKESLGGSAWELEVQEHPRKMNIIIDYDDNNNSNNNNNNNNKEWPKNGNTANVEKKNK
jgi:hypothetical protein